MPELKKLSPEVIEMLRNDAVFQGRIMATGHATYHNIEYWTRKNLQINFMHPQILEIILFHMQQNGHDLKTTDDLFVSENQLVN